MTDDDLLDEDALDDKGLPLDLSDEDGESGILDDEEEDPLAIPEGMHEIEDDGF
ncbi:MAG: hypothetical protein V4480_01635 [Patescibacteria group bacterium]